MKSLKLLPILLLTIFSSIGFAQVKLDIDGRNVPVGETLYYKAKWGFLTVGTGFTRVDKKLNKIGSNSCYKIDISGQTNGLAKLFYVQDKWTSYIDTGSFSTHKAYRSIREGRHKLDEQVSFDHVNNKAEVKVYDWDKKSFVLKKVYETPENVRDVVAGFMVVRLVDLSKLSKGQVFSINGFYEDEGYNINVLFMGEEIINTEKGKMRCYRVKPMVPKNDVFDGRNAVDVWLSADKSQTIMRIRAKMFVGNILIDLVDNLD